MSMWGTQTSYRKGRAAGSKASQFLCPKMRQELEMCLWDRKQSRKAAKSRRVFERGEGVKSAPGHYRRLTQSRLTLGMALMPAMEATWLLMWSDPAAAQKTEWTARFHPRTEPALAAGGWISFRPTRWRDIWIFPLSKEREESILGNRATINSIFFFPFSFFLQTPLGYKEKGTLEQTSLGAWRIWIRDTSECGKLVRSLQVFQTEFHFCQRRAYKVMSALESRAWLCITNSFKNAGPLVFAQKISLTCFCFRF